MKATLMNSLGLKILSVIAAALLWLVVVNLDDPVKTETYSGIRVSMLNESAITGKGKVYKIEDDSDLISVTVSARRSVQKKLTSADFIATADMEKDIQYDNLVSINVSCTNREVNSADIKKSRNNVKVSIEDSATEEFNVVVKQKGSPGSGYVVGEMVPEQRVIAVSGPASLIHRIKRIEAEVDVTGRTADDTLVCSLRILNSDGDTLDTTYLQYNGKSGGMAVNITMLKTKTVPLKVDVTGTPAADCRYTGISYKPEIVEIAGSPDSIRNLRAIQIPGEAVNMDGFTETRAVEVNLVPHLPANTRLVDPEAEGLIVVTVNIEKLETRNVSLPVSAVALTGVAGGYSVTFGTQSEIQIPVRGLSSDLDALNADEIAVTLDVSSARKKGIYTGTLQIRIPGACTAEENVEIEYELLKGDGGRGNTSQ